MSIQEVHGSATRKIHAIQFDSRKIEPNDLFVAVRGTQADGHAFIEMAIQKGASVIICEELPKTRIPEITYLVVKDSSVALGLLASAFYHHPSQNLKLVGVTGTNGKTTTATLLYQMFRQLGYKAGLLSTIRNYIGNAAIESTHTTPDQLQINALLAEMVDAGCDYCFMEVSSHAAHQHRIAGLQFVGAIFSNITQDHLDYHKTFAEYIKAKKMFFDQLPEGSFALVNADDKNGRVMQQNTKARKFSFGLKSMADFRGRVLESYLDGMLVSFDQTEIWTRFIGGFNAYNLLSVYASALLLGQDREQVVKALSSLNSVDGRFQSIKSPDGKIAIVDYAHTPDALENVLATVQQIREGNNKIITVVGAGGNRDKTKRPLMAAIVARMSDQVILTSDNPRNERPEDIIDDMKAGVLPPYDRKVLSIANRTEAIRTACMLAQPGDIILVAGKGHETYQEINGVKHHFDDREIINKLFETN